MAEPEALQIKRIMDDLDRFAENAIIDITLELADELKMQTPVLTGYAKANWIIDDEPVPEPVGPPGNPISAASIQAAQEGHTLGYKLARGPLHLSNAVPYILNIVSTVKVITAISGALQRANLGIRRRR